MGRTLPSVTQVFLKEQESFLRFRRALRRSDQKALDDLFAAAHKHIAAAAYASHALPFEVFLLSMLLEEHKQVLRMRYLLSPSDAAALEQLERDNSTAFLDELSAGVEAINPASLPDAGDEVQAAAPQGQDDQQPTAPHKPGQGTSGDSGAVQPGVERASHDSGTMPDDPEGLPTETRGFPADSGENHPESGAWPPDSGGFLINFHG